MADIPKSQTQPSPLCGSQIGTVLIGHLVARLEVEAGKNGGTLSAGDIRAAAERFISDEMPHFQSTFQRSFDQCTLRREASHWSSIRKHPLDRILTKKFAKLFPPRNGDDGGLGILSRQVIPGFNLAITKMIGPMLYEQCQQKAASIVERHPASHGGFDWDGVYADPKCRTLTLDVLVIVAHYFGDFDRRRNWFMDMINGNLAPAKAHDEMPDNWQLTHHSFAEMMRALFADMQSDLTTRPEKLLARYGDFSVAALTAFLERLKIET